MVLPETLVFFDFRDLPPVLQISGAGGWSEVWIRTSAPGLGRSAIWLGPFTVSPGSVPLIRGPSHLPQPCTARWGPHSAFARALHYRISPPPSPASWSSLLSSHCCRCYPAAKFLDLWGPLWTRWHGSTHWQGMANLIEPKICCTWDTWARFKIQSW